MFKLSIQGEGLNLDVDVNFKITQRIISVVMEGKFGPTVIPTQQAPVRLVTVPIQTPDTSEPIQETETDSADGEPP
jgi:hypothetical protein